jgi:MraZ protein
MLGLNGCLFLVPRAEWRRIQSKFDQFNFAHGDANYFMRVLMLNTHEISPDTQGRFQIPTELAGKVGIDHDVRLLGMNRRIEIWSANKLDEYIAGYGKSYEEVAAQLLL